MFCCCYWYVSDVFLIHWSRRGKARTQSPTTKNYAPELPSFREIVGVACISVQWCGLALEEPPSWSRLTSTPSKYDPLTHSVSTLVPMQIVGIDRFIFWTEFQRWPTLNNWSFWETRKETNRPCRVQIKARDNSDVRPSSGRYFRRDLLLPLCTF